jgi:uncharacterized phage-associated protein
MGTIRFKVSYAKAIETLVWLAKMKPEIDIYHVAKVLFYADKMHLNKYLRPIIGDDYVRMPYGPVPSGVLNLIKKNMWLSPNQLRIIKASLDIDDADNFKLTALRDPDMDYFSKSDIECLTDALNKYGNLSFDQLYELTHSEKCYSETAPNEKIDYALWIDENDPLRDETLDHMRELSQYVQM